MYLERSQAAHNGVISNIGNSSASNDPKQIPNDANDLLIKGAQVAAAAQELGLSEEETLAAVSRQARRQSQRRAFKLKKNENVRWAQSQKTLRDEGFDPFFVDNDVIDTNDLTEEERVFGQTDYEMGLRDLDADSGIDTREPEYEQVGTRTYKKTGKQYPIGNPVRPQERSDFQPEVAPKSALGDALAALSGSTATGAIDARERLTRQIEGGADIELQRFLAGELAEADRATFDPELRQYNDFRAEAESQAIAREYFGGYGSGSMADEAIGRIGEVRKLGGSGVLSQGENAQVIRFSDDRPAGNPIIKNGVYVDPNTGNPIAIQGPDTPPAFQGANTPNTAQAQNAPTASNAATWMQANLPTPPEGGRVFGDYPQVDITLETTNFAQKLRELDGFGLEGISSNVRSRDELQRASDFVVRRAQEQGKPLYIRDEATGKNVRSVNPGVAEVMQLLRMSPGDQSRLANALYQIEMSQDSPQKDVYLSRSGGPTAGVTFDAPEAVDPSQMQAPVARIPKGSTIRGPGGQRQTIVEQLAGLEGSDAQKPFIGQIQGEAPRVNRRKPGNMGSGDELQANIEAQAASRAKGKPVDEGRVRQNVVKARLAEEREKRDAAKREATKREITPFVVDRTRPVFGSRIMSNLR